MTTINITHIELDWDTEEERLICEGLNQGLIGTYTGDFGTEEKVSDFVSSLSDFCVRDVQWEEQN